MTPNYAFDYAVFKYRSWALSVYSINGNNIFPVIANNQFYENATGLQFYTKSSGNIIDPRNKSSQWSGPLVHDNIFANNTNHIYRTQGPAATAS